VRGGYAVAYGRELPVEGRVECESVPSHLINHVQISLSFSARMRALAPGQLDTVRGLYRTAYPLAEDALTGAKGKRTTQMLPLARNHVFDGITFLAEVAISAHDTRVNGFGISNALKTQLTDAAAEVTGSFGRPYEQLRPGDAEAWAPSYLEYQYACAAEAQGVPQTVLTADQYTSVHLD
jgi:hypothetical protein